jgi:SAM-dependent methyltransferase
MLDVLHHLENPVVFLAEAARVLRPGGSLAMIEPGMSPFSTPIYSHFHQEPVDVTADPFAPTTSDIARDPFDSNQAIPTLLFRSHESRAELARRVPELVVVELEWLSLLAYPLSGGFKSWCLVPSGLVRPLIRIEDAMPAALRRIFGFRLFIRLQRI